MTTLKLEFYLRFYTHPGQSILLSGNLSELGNGDIAAAIPLEYVNGEFWHRSLVLAEVPPGPIHYHYVLKNPDGTLTEEWGDDKFIEPGVTGVEELQVIDTWNHAGEFENVFYTSPFRQVLLPRHKTAKKHKRKVGTTHIFRVKAPLLQEDEVVGLLGNAGALNDWNTDDPAPLVLSPEGDWWTLALSIPPESFPIEYKYAVIHKKDRRLIRFEEGPNRRLPGVV
jgi:4-alpha-glucanotransferase